MIKVYFCNYKIAQSKTLEYALPLKFNPLFEERIWGGDQLRRKMDKKLPEGKLIGESWELSAVPGNVSVVANGQTSRETASKS